MRIAPLSPLLLVLATASVARADDSSPPPADALASIVGTVESTASSWSSGGRFIVTDSKVRTDDGRLITLRQLGGKVGELRMWVSHVPSVEPVVGARIEATVPSAALGTDAPVRVVDLFPASDAAGQRTYVPTRTGGSQSALRWAGREISVTYEADGTTHLDGDREFEVFDGVLATWEAAADTCGGLAFTVEEPVDMEVGLDDVNLFIFREDRWCRPDEDDGEFCYSPNAAAITTVYFIDNPESNRDGVIVEADIEINAVDFAVSDNGVTNSSASCLSDLANTMTHEVGHLLGLDHTCVDRGSAVDGNGEPVPQCGPGLDAEVLATTMFPSQTCGETAKSTPEQDDIDGLCAMLVLADEASEFHGTDKGGCGCRATGTNGAAGSLLLALGALIALRRRRR